MGQLGGSWWGGIGRVLRDRDGVGLVMFSKHVYCMESNEAKVVAILEVLQIFVPSTFKLSWLWKATL